MGEELGINAIISGSGLCILALVDVCSDAVIDGRCGGQWRCWGYFIFMVKYGHFPEMDRRLTAYINIFLLKLVAINTRKLML